MEEYRRILCAKHGPICYEPDMIWHWSPALMNSGMKRLGCVYPLLRSCLLLISTYDDDGSSAAFEFFCPKDQEGDSRKCLIVNTGSKGMVMKGKNILLCWLNEIVILPYIVVYKQHHIYLLPSSLHTTINHMNKLHHVKGRDETNPRMCNTNSYVVISRI
jgi:hypothetical protein